MVMSNNIIGNPMMEYGMISATGAQNEQMSNMGLYLSAAAGNDMAENALQYSMVTGAPPNSNIGLYILADEARNGNSQAQQLLDYQLVSGMINRYTANGNPVLMKAHQQPSTEQQPGANPSATNQQNTPTNILNGLGGTLGLIGAASMDNDAAQAALEFGQRTLSIPAMNPSELKILAQSALLGNDYSKDMLQYQSMMSMMKGNNIGARLLQREHVVESGGVQPIPSENVIPNQVESAVLPEEIPVENVVTEPIITEPVEEHLSQTSPINTATTAGGNSSQPGAPKSRINIQDLRSMYAMEGDYRKVMELDAIINAIRSGQVTKNQLMMYYSQHESPVARDIFQMEALSQMSKGTVGSQMARAEFMKESDLAQELVKFKALSSGVTANSAKGSAILDQYMFTSMLGLDTKDLIRYQFLPQEFESQISPNSSNAGNSQTNSPSNNTPIDSISQPSQSNSIPTQPNSEAPSNVPSTPQTNSPTSQRLNITLNDLRGVYMINGEYEKIPIFDMMNNALNQGMNPSSLMMMDHDVSRDMLEVLILQNNINRSGGMANRASTLAILGNSDIGTELMEYKAMAHMINQPSSYRP